MLKMLDIGIDNAIAFRISGKVTEDDMELVFSEMKGKIRAYGDIVLYEQIDSFDGVELAGIIDKIQYLFEMGISKISRVAIVTDKQWVSKIVCLENKIFRNVGMQCFPLEQKAEAVDFLRSRE
tara:strand:- start:908 stop:1276 length:369 start_codon:yes stop_codon:yes gene_type:complete